jgi:hypothetical protein
MIEHWATFFISSTLWPRRNFAGSGGVRPEESPPGVAHETGDEIDLIPWLEEGIHAHSMVRLSDVRFALISLTFRCNSAFNRLGFNGAQEVGQGGSVQLHRRSAEFIQSLDVLVSLPRAPGIIAIPPQCG